MIKLTNFNKISKKFHQRTILTDYNFYVDSSYYKTRLFMSLVEPDWDQYRHKFK